MKTSKLSSLLVISSMLMLAGCFDSLSSSNRVASSTSTTSAITSAQFTGVSTAVNKVTGILISWPGVTDVSLVKAYRVYRVSGSKKTLLTTLAPSLNSFMDGTVTWGSIYAYQVNAVDQNGIEDSNTKTVKAVSWSGISSVQASSRTSLVVSFANLATVIDEIRIYAQLGVGGNKTLVATISGSDTSVEVTGLRTGYNYIISAQGYISSLGKEDGNDVTFKVPTMTVGYDNDGSDSSQWRNVMSVRAFGEAPAAPVHPSGSNQSPSARTVELTFNAFSSQGTAAKYVVVRTVDGKTLDSSVTAACTDTSQSSCVVCSMVTPTNGVVYCRDTNVAASPARYRYSMALSHTDTATNETWVEPLPSNLDQLESYSVLVPIPPKNMVLVQRDAANYEMCIQMNKTSDPVNNNRCVYSGIGGQPYSSGHNKSPLNLPTGYYDFGYNLFVDRWETACNWTMASQGGKCGPNHTDGDCIGYGANLTTKAPQPDIGKVGDVYYYLGTSSNGNNECFIAESADGSGNINWMRASDVYTSVSGVTLANKMLTNDPGYYDTNGNLDRSLPGKRGKISYKLNQISAAYMCSANTDAYYGTKRLVRQRENVVIAAPALLSGEPYAHSSYATFYANYFQGNQNHGTYAGCDAASAVDTLPTTFADMLNLSGTYKEMIRFTDGSGGTSYGFRTYMPGALATIDCVSRYGVQDFNTRRFTSDIISYSTSTQLTTGLMSPYDNGNRDFLSDITGGQTGYVIDVTKYTSGGISYNSTNLTALIPALGLPIVTANPSSEYLAKALIIQPYNFGQTGPVSGSGSGTKMFLSSGRWNARYDFAVSNDTVQGELRCVLPAE
ncbi:hypothetical protein [Bdellovibrio sp. KM01]|uniref:hypothetical protein n=1 Tax=Bdellovibrio sp. KM01 TaxID=2748865 RepID=UPI0015EA99B9|nr:hypothetical protein [Bdellovibrio sp. KM01]QLY24249.1 hypothetical protein HW988_12330 [Bdellovibrio sp. KM01]